MDDTEIKIICTLQDANEAATAEQIYVQIKQLLRGSPQRACLNAMTWALIACYIDAYKGEGPETLLNEVYNMYAIMTKRKPAQRN